MKQKTKTTEEKLKQANAWVWESQWVAREWRTESWRDCEIYDGGASAWTQGDWDDAVDSGIDPLTVNRAFPSINKLLGSQVVNRFEIVAKGRSDKDSEISQVMTEGIKFVMDQYGGEFLISSAHSDALVPGFGCLSPCYSHDPRRERVALKYRDWKEIWWDPFSSPWWTIDRTRYVYWQPWVDLDDFKAIFPEKEKEIEAAYQELSGATREYGFTPIDDEAQLKEDKIRTLAACDWADTERRRIRPVEMWYTQNERCMFSLFADGRCFEIKDEMPPQQAFELIRSGNQILWAVVKKVRNMTFFGEHLMLQDTASPYGHDQFPLVPFVGYIDRWGFPYGVPRQIRGEQEEINKRRSMALAMLKKRRVTIEEDAVTPPGNQEVLDKIYEEANKIDGFMVLRSGALGKMKIEDLAQLSQYQIELMRQSEFEVRDITGSDAPYFQGERGQSGIAKQKDERSSQITTATLLDNLRRSMGILGYQTIANIQNAWTYEKVLRVTDRLTGAERFVRVNEPMNGGYELKNNITQGKYDCVVSEAPITDTVRAKNLDMLYAAIEKSPPQAVPTLLIAAFEMSDLPNKELLLEKLRPIMGMQPGEEGMDPAEAKQQAMAALKQQQEKESMLQNLELEGIKTKLQEAKLKNIELEAKIQKLTADTKKVAVETDILQDEAQEQQTRNYVEGIERGMGINERVNVNGALYSKKQNSQ